MAHRMTQLFGNREFLSKSQVDIKDQVIILLTNHQKLLRY